MIVVGKSFAAMALVLALRYPLNTALTVAASLAQIGEFSFILAGMGTALGFHRRCRLGLGLWRRCAFLRRLCGLRHVVRQSFGRRTESGNRSCRRKTIKLEAGDGEAKGDAGEIEKVLEPGRRGGFDVTI